MKKTMTTVPFNGTAEQKAALDALIAAHKGEAGALMPVLQQAQDIYGYLPVEVQKEIAAGLDVPYSEVFGVVTFYSQFLLNPKGAHPVSVCLGTACYVKGSGKLMEKLEELLGLYDKLVMLIKAKAMMDQAAETLKAGETEIGTAWYKLQQTKAGLADTEERLKNEKKQLIKDYNKLSEVDRTVDEYDDLTARQKAARTALVLYPDIKTRTEAGEDVAAAAQAVRDSMEKELEREFAGRLGISILCIAAGICGILTLPAAFERMRTYPALRVFAILCLACAVGAECVGLFMGWGQTYAAVFGALFALLVLLVGGRAKIAAI